MICGFYVIVVIIKQVKKSLTRKCGYNYKACKKQNLDKHMHETHKNGRDRLKCNECDHKESSKDCLKYHMAAKHDRELFRCEKCDYKSAT